MKNNFNLFIHQCQREGEGGDEGKREDGREEVSETHPVMLTPFGSAMSMVFRFIFDKNFTANR